jgi:PHD/YefM family antitoxin component YafN of YafNO toxin-antitoxin module
MFFIKAPHTQITSAELAAKLPETLVAAEENGHVYILSENKPVAILLSMKTFRKLHAFAEDKIMDKIRSF